MSKPISQQNTHANSTALLGRRIDRVRISGLYSERNNLFCNQILD